MHKIRMFFFIVLMVFLISLMSDSIYAYTIIGDSVYWENTFAKLNVTPHTLTTNQNYSVEITNKKSQEGYLNIAFIFDDNIRGKVYVFNGSDYIDTTYVVNHITKPIGEVYYITDIYFSAYEKRKFKWNYYYPNLMVNGKKKFSIYAWIGSYDNPTYDVMLDPWTEVTGCIEYTDSIKCANGTFTGNYINTTKNIIIYNATLDGTTGGLINLTSTAGWIQINQSTINAYQTDVNSNFLAKATGNIYINGSTINAYGSGQSKNGNILLNATNGSITIFGSSLNSYGDGAQYSPSNSVQGGSGSLIISTPNDLIINDTTLSSNGGQGYTASGSTCGSGGNSTINIQANKIYFVSSVDKTYSFNGGKAMSSSGGGTGKNGDSLVNINASQIFMQGNNKSVLSIQANGGVDTFGECTASISKFNLKVNNRLDIDSNITISVLNSGTVNNYSKINFTGNDSLKMLFSGVSIPNDKFFVFCPNKPTDQNVSVVWEQYIGKTQKIDFSYCSYENTTRSLYFNTAPTITSISDGTDPIEEETTQTITPSGQADSQNDNLYIYCCQDTDNTCTPTISDLCNNNQAWSSPYATMTCTLTTADISQNTTYYSRCRLYDNQYYSSTVSASYNVFECNANNDCTAGEYCRSYTANCTTKEPHGSVCNLANLSSSSDGVDSICADGTCNAGYCNRLPTINQVNITSLNRLNKTNESLFCNYSWSDLDSDTITLNETRWYNSTKYLSALDNLTIISSANTSKGENWSCSVRVYDSYNWSSWLNSTNLTILNAPPETPTITSPYNNEINNTRKIEFYATDIDGDSLSYTIYINNTLNITTNTNITVWNGSDGYYSLTITSNDSSGYSANSTVIHFTLDSTPPHYSNIITKGTNKTNTVVTFNATWSDDLSSLSGWIFENNISRTYQNSTFNTTWGSNKESTYNLLINLTRGYVFGWRFYANDSLGNINNTPLQTFTVANTVPTTPILISPSDLSSISTNYTILKTNCTDPDNSTDTITFYYYGDQTTNPTTLIFNGSGWDNSSYNWSNLNDGSYYWKTQCGDGYDNSSNSSVNKFTVNTVSPAITLNYPSNNLYLNTVNVSNFNVTVSDPDGIYECQLWHDINGSWLKNQTNTTTITNGVVYSFAGNNNTPDQNSHKWNVWCNDTLGNGGFYVSNFTFHIDTLNPNVTLSSPSNGGSYTSLSIDLRHTETDYSLYSCQYNYEVGGASTSNTTVTCNANQTITFTAYGTYIFNYYVLDFAGNVNTTQVNFTISTPTTTPPLGGSGAETPEEEEKPMPKCTNESSWSISSLGLRNRIDTILKYGAISPSRTEFLLSNKGFENLSINLRCEDVNNTICQNVSLTQQVELPPSQFLAKEIGMLVYLPNGTDYDEQFVFNIVADDSTCYSLVNVFSSTPSRYSPFKRFIVIGQLELSVTLVSIIAGLLTAIVIGIIFGALFDLPYLGWWFAFVSLAGLGGTLFFTL